MSEYDAQKDGFESYNAAIGALRAKHLQEHCPSAQRVVVIGQCELYLGNCLEIMPSIGAVNHVISDPPYEDELHAAFGKKIDRNDGDHLPRSANMLKPLEFSGINGIRSEVARLAVSVSSGWVILFTLAEGVRAWRDDIQAAGAKWDTTCFWIKPDSSPRFNGQGPARGAECFVTAWCAPGYRSWNAGGKRGIYTHLTNHRDRDGRHPTEKPIPLMKEIVCDFTKPEQTILDPFMGSGTTGVACAQMGRRFIGIEMDPSHFEVACERIRKAYLQPDMFVSQPASKQAKQEAFL